MSNVIHEDRLRLRRKASVKTRTRVRSRMNPPELEPVITTIVGDRRALQKRLSVINQYVAVKRPLTVIEQAELTLIKLKLGLSTE